MKGKEILCAAWLVPSWQERCGSPRSRIVKLLLLRTECQEPQARGDCDHSEPWLLLCLYPDPRKSLHVAAVLHRCRACGPSPHVLCRAEANRPMVVVLSRGLPEPQLGSNMFHQGSC